jgi:hypothetical protein
MFVRLISHQPTVLFSQNKPATSNQPAVLFSQNKSAPAISHQPNEFVILGDVYEATNIHIFVEMMVYKNWSDMHIFVRKKRGTEY